jgi:hypothetical protein
MKTYECGVCEEKFVDCACVSKPVDEFTFCDDCGGTNHTYENCPMTRDFVLIPDDEAIDCIPLSDLFELGPDGDFHLVDY